MKRAGFRLPTGLTVVVAALFVFSWAMTAWADSGSPGYPDDPLRPMLATRDILIYVQMRPAVGPPIPVISITPDGTDPRAKVKIESSIPSLVDFYYFYKGKHPYFQVSPLIDIRNAGITPNWFGYWKILDVLSGIFVVDTTGGIRTTAADWCYTARAVDTGGFPDPLDWSFSAPSNVVCDWDYALTAPAALTHWNQVVVPLKHLQTDTLGGWARRDSGATEIDEWTATTQSWSLRTNKIGNNWLFGNRLTRYVHAYHITGSTIRFTHATWGDVVVYAPSTGLTSDTCFVLQSNAALTDLNNVVIQAAWHWFQTDSTNRRTIIGGKLYDGTPATDTGVREILEWTASTQSWASRTLWNGTAWTLPLTDVRVYKPYMFKRSNTNIPGGGTATTYCWPPLMR